MGQCQLCKKEVEIPYKCTFCGQYFCDEHKLPENHLCPAIPKREWSIYRRLKSAREGYGWNTEKKKPIISHEHFYDHDPSKYPWNQRKLEKPSKGSSIGRFIIIILILGGIVVILNEFGFIDLITILLSIRQYFKI
ncbi:MAG: AN1-type zinc finger domain-containing protein [Candidatus Hodarchaeales archaeon]